MSLCLLQILGTLPNRLTPHSREFFRHRWTVCARLRIRLQRINEDRPIKLLYIFMRQPDHRDVRAMKKRDILRPNTNPLIALRRQAAKDMLITLEGGALQ